MKDKPQAPLDKAKIAAEIYPSATAPPTNREVNSLDLLQQEITLIKNYHANNENMIYLYGALFCFFVLGPIFAMVNILFSMVSFFISLYLSAQALNEAKKFEFQTGKKSKTRTATYIMIVIISFVYFTSLLGTAMFYLNILQSQN